MEGEQHARRWGRESCAHEANSIRKVASVTMDDSGLQHLILQALVWLFQGPEAGLICR